MKYEKVLLQIALGLVLAALAWPFVQEGVKNFIAFSVFVLFCGGILLGILEGLYDSFRKPSR